MPKSIKTVEQQDSGWHKKTGQLCAKPKEMRSSVGLTIDGKREELNVDFVLSIESFEA